MRIPLSAPSSSKSEQKSSTEKFDPSQSLRSLGLIGHLDFVLVSLDFSKAVVDILGESEEINDLQDCPIIENRFSVEAAEHLMLHRFH